jgi:hypothetical protein
VNTSERGNARRGSVGGTSGNTGPFDTDFLDAKILEAAACGLCFQLAGDSGLSSNGMKDKEAVKRFSLLGRENL